MRRRLVSTTVLALALAAASATGASAASPEISTEQARQALLEARSAFATPLAGGGAGSRDVTAALRDLAVALPALEGADRRAGRELLARPTDKNDRGYFGREADDSPVCDSQFCVHWTDKAKNAPVNGQYLDDVLDAMALSYTVENGALGWKDAKSDGKLGKRRGVGGDGQVDVYITNLGPRLYGYASTDRGQRGLRRYAYLVLDNDYKGFPLGPTESMQVTAAHEYNHILQFNYDVFQDLWLFEATATWAEDKVYPGIDDYLNYVPDFAKRPDVPMTGKSIRVYSEAVWNHWLSYKYGDDVVRRTWEKSPSAKNFAIAAYHKAIKVSDPSTSVAEELGQFFADTAEWHSSAAFPDVSEYPDVKRSGKLGAATVKTTLDNTSFRLYKVNPTGSDPYTVKIKAERGTQSMVALVGRQGAEPGVIYREFAYLPNGGTATIELPNNGYQRVTAMAANVDGRSNRRDSKGRRIYKSDGSDYKLTLK